MYIRTRVTLWFLFIVTFVLVAFSVFTYQVTSNTLLSWEVQHVRNEEKIVETRLQHCPGTLQSCIPGLDSFTSPDTFIQVQNLHGSLLASSDNLGKHTLPLFHAAIVANQVRETKIEAVTLFIYCHPITINHQQSAYLIVAQSPQTIYFALSELVHFLYPGVAGALGLAGLVIWLLVRHAMLPLEQLVVAASAIAESKDHSRRLTAPRKRNDEISRLTHMMNAMLQALEASYQEVQKINDIQRTFLIDVSHELRTPLTVILSSLDLIHKVGAADPEFQNSSLERIRVEIARMARMVTQLLFLARSDAHVTATYEPVLVGDVLADLCSQRYPNEKEPDLHCQHLERLEGALVWGNPDYLKQLFLILLDNACKYTPATGKVEVSGNLETGTVTITVSDTGIGISPGEIPRVFERFHRASNARFQSGAGLGLAIAQRIVEQHHGTITVTSELEQGSCFTITLPCLEGGIEKADSESQ